MPIPSCFKFLFSFSFFLFFLFFFFKTIQRLYPQCQKCFSLQGTAVKSNNHLLIFHTMFKLHHFTPAIVYFLFLDLDFQKYVESYFDINKINEITELVKTLLF